MTDRESTGRGPRLDEELRRETESLERGAPVEARVEEQREKEPRDGPALGARDVEARRELSRHLRPSAFPADRDALVREAHENDAPDPVVEALRSLPASTAFATVGEAWAALADPELAEDPESLRAEAAADPLSDSDR